MRAGVGSENDVENRCIQRDGLDVYASRSESVLVLGKACRFDGTDSMDCDVWTGSSFFLIRGMRCERVATRVHENSHLILI